jgi:hypothetical protein
MPATGGIESFTMSFGSTVCGSLKSVSGGDVTAEVIREAPAEEFFLQKHLGTPYYEDFVIVTGLQMVNRFYSWISASWAGKYQHREGAIFTMDGQGNAKLRQDYFNAYLTETTIPALDSSSKDRAFLTLKFNPGSTVVSKASGRVKVPVNNVEWLCSNFRLDIDGLECSKVKKIDSFTVKQAFAGGVNGGGDNRRGEPGKLDFPNLKITMLESSADTWFKWQDDFVLRGNNNEDRERNGVLSFLSRDQKAKLAYINFHNLGIFKLAREVSNAGTKLVTAELYCERMEFIAPNK